MKLIIFNLILFLCIENILAKKTYRDQFKPVCGRPTTTGRIIGGSSADIGEYPFMTRIGLNEHKKTFFFCGGALITNRHILTAKHCFYTIIKQNDVPGALVVRLGDHKAKNRPACLDKFCSDPPVLYSVEKLTQYNTDTSSAKHDIALLKLAKEVKFTRFISPICMPDNISPTTLIGESVVVIGFGLVNSRRETLAKILQKVTVSIKPISDCAVFSQPPGPGQICAGGSTKDSCDGDSGGPLFKLIPKMDGPRFTLLGIVSFGAPVCGKMFPAVYTDVNYYLQWIDNNL